MVPFKYRPLLLRPIQLLRALGVAEASFCFTHVCEEEMDVESSAEGLCGERDKSLV